MKTELARELSKFVTIQRALPLGLPESPVISNIICFELDVELEKLSLARGLRYTRYADDMTFSGSSNLPSKQELRDVLRRHGFTMSERKYRLSKRGQAHFVTGLSVAEKDYPHAPRQMKKLLRQELYFCGKLGLSSHASRRGEPLQKTLNRISGLVSYIAYVEKRQADTLRSQWLSILKKEPWGVSYAAIAGRDPRSLQLVVDETEFETKGVGYIALCFARNLRVRETCRAINRTLVGYITNPGAKGQLDGLWLSGLHYTDSHYDLRAQAFSRLMEIEWSACILFMRQPSHSEYAKTWLHLFKLAVQQEILTGDGVVMDILVEQNDKISKSALMETVQKEYTDALSRQARRPIAVPTLTIARKKETPALTIPDFILAAFRHYILQATNDSVLDFERLRDRIRYVLDADLDAHYSRKRPFVEIENR